MRNLGAELNPLCSPDVESLETLSFTADGGYSGTGSPGSSGAGSEEGCP